MGVLYHIRDYSVFIRVLESSDKTKPKIEKKTKATMGVNSVQNLSKHISLERIPLKGEMNISEVSNIQLT